MFKELRSHIWDSWADENGSIGKAYGYQMGVKHQYKEGMMDQTDRVIYDLKNNPYQPENHDESVCTSGPA